MKCEMAKDLITLYAEQLCSAESANELEKHLKECPECARILKHYKSEIEDNKEESQNEPDDLKPMKKIGQKLRFRKGLSICLGAILTILIIILSFLGYGQMTNCCISFSSIADTIKIKAACEDLVNGDTSTLLELIAIHNEDRYRVTRVSSFKDFDEFKDSIKIAMDNAYEYHFKGKKVDVKIDEVYLWPKEEAVAYDESSMDVIVKFYENDVCIYTMEFYKVSDSQFQIYEESGNPNITFTSQLMPYDELILEICLKYAVKNEYEKLVNGEKVERIGGAISLGIEKPGTEQEIEEYRLQLRNRVEDLYSCGWYIKDTMFMLDEFDANEGKWIYKVWFMLEDQTNGNIGIMEQKFYFDDYNLFAIEGVNPEIIAVNGQVPKDIEEKILNLFPY